MDGFNGKSPRIKKIARWIVDECIVRTSSGYCKIYWRELSEKFCVTCGWLDKNCARIVKLIDRDSRTGGDVEVDNDCCGISFSLSLERRFCRNLDGEGKAKLAWDKAHDWYMRCSA